MNDFKTDPISRLKENKGHTSQIKITYKFLTGLNKFHGPLSVKWNKFGTSE